MIKQLLMVLIFGGMGLYAQAQTEPAKANTNIITAQVVEASCGECQFGMKGNGCNLAIKFDGKSYFVKGASMDDFGDAHAQDGFCNAIKKAKVSGKIVKNKFVSKKFELIPEKAD